MDAAFATGRPRLWSTVGAGGTNLPRVLEKIGFERHHETMDDLGRPLIYLTRQVPAP